ncbi:MAG: DEAD/DEAH box helicase, partial [Gemmatimonadaceae bacterium]
MSRLIHVALPVRLYRPLTYAVEGPWAESVRPGARVVVPLRARRAVGVVTALDVEGNGRAIRRVLDVPNEPTALPAALLQTCEWMARYYAAPIGLVLRAALPSLLSGTGCVRKGRGRRIVTIAQELPSLAERDRLFARAPKQRTLYEALESLGGSAPLALLRERGHDSPSALTALAKRGLLRVSLEEQAADPFAAARAPAAPALQPTPAQQHAIERILASGAGDVTLLHGVTGSGKTLVYLEALRAVLRGGRSAIVLVPEIALTPQTVGRFRAVFGDEVAVLHSALGERERMEAWRALRAGPKRIAVGARSAIFAPLERVGAIVVDEEHEATYKQEETPRYHARDVAIVRART